MVGQSFCILPAPVGSNPVVLTDCSEPRRTRPQANSGGNHAIVSYPGGIAEADGAESLCLPWPFSVEK